MSLTQPQADAAVFILNCYARCFLELPADAIVVTTEYRNGAWILIVTTKTDVAAAESIVHAAAMIDGFAARHAQ